MHTFIGQPTVLPEDHNRWDALRPHEALVEAHLQDANYTAALNALVEGYNKVIFGFCTRLLQGVYPADWIEEAVQDIFIDVYQAMPKFRRDASVTTWVFAIARNRCFRVLRDHYRRHQLRETHSDKITAHTQMSPPPELEDELLVHEQHELLRYSLTQLRRKRDRDLLTMRYLQEMTIVEIARFYRRPESTVRGWLSVALNQLQTQYMKSLTVQRSTGAAPKKR